MQKLLNWKLLVILLLPLALNGCRTVNITVTNEAGTVTIDSRYDAEKEVGVSPEIKVPLIP